MEKKYENILSLFDNSLRNAVLRENIDSAEEIRLRAGRNAEIVYDGRSVTLDVIPSAEDIYSALRKSMRCSMFANEEELRTGRVVIPGGHRVSFCGRALRKNSRIVSQDCFSSLSVRISREKKGCSKEVMKYIRKNGQVYSTLLLSPPGVGKTTLLRDVAREISSGKDSLRTVIIDEKCEIASAVNGVNGLDCGQRCDVMSLFDKSSGIHMAIRNMNPQVIVCDEIGSSGDCSALSEAARCGTAVIATAHAGTLTDLLSRPATEGITQAKIFDRYIFISRRQGTIYAENVYDRNLAEVWG